MITAEDRMRSMIARLTAFARGVYRDDLRLQWAAFAFLLIFYAPVQWALWSRHHGDRLNLTFNSMLAHLLRGRFDVDPQIVGFEGFVRNGRTYAYWGVWCALLRLPLWIARRMDVDITLWSCLAAICVAGMAKVRAVLMLRRHGRQSATAAWAIGLMLAFVLLGRCEAYVAVSVYLEVVLWAYAFASLFVYLALKGMVNRRFDLGTLSWMALFAGLALLTRVSTGIGLLLALVLLLAVMAVQAGSGEEGQRWLRIRGVLVQPRMLVPLAILAALVAVTGAVNYFRWGNPATFANYNLYLSLKGDNLGGGWLPMRQFGLFSVRRIPFGLIYYFLPIWVWHGRNGHLVFQDTLTRMYWVAEGPASSLFVTDLLPIGFIVLLGIAWRRWRAGGFRPAGQWAAALAAGLLAPCILMLMAIYLAYRYRVDFFPEIDFLAFLGLYGTVTHAGMRATFARFRRWMSAALAVSLAGNFCLLLVPHANGLHLHFLEGLQRYFDPLGRP